MCPKFPILRFGGLDVQFWVESRGRQWRMLRIFPTETLDFSNLRGGLNVASTGDACLTPSKLCVVTWGPAQVGWRLEAPVEALQLDTHLRVCSGVWPIAVAAMQLYS